MKELHTGDSTALIFQTQTDNKIHNTEVIYIRAIGQDVSMKMSLNLVAAMWMFYDKGSGL